MKRIKGQYAGRCTIMQNGKACGGRMVKVSNACYNGSGQNPNLNIGVWCCKCKSSIAIPKGKV